MAMYHFPLIHCELAQLLMHACWRNHEKDYYHSHSFVKRVLLKIEHSHYYVISQFRNADRKKKVSQGMLDHYVMLK